MNARTIFEMGGAVLGALESIERLTHVGGDKADAALLAIRAVLEAVEHGFKGHLLPADVLKQIDQLELHIATNDAAALAILHERFKKA